MHKFGSKSALVGYFWLKFWKTIVIFETSTIKFDKSEFLAHTVNFCVGALFLRVCVPLFLKIGVRVRVCLMKYALFQIGKNLHLVLQ